MTETTRADIEVGTAVEKYEITGDSNNFTVPASGCRAW